MHGYEMAALANDLRELGQPVVAGFSTHPHWDHLLWHAPGYAALLIEERGVLVAGDMLSDVLIPLLDLSDTADPVADYLAALRLLEGMAGDVDVLVPGHGSIGGADQADAYYISGALANAAKHAKATAVDISVGHHGHALDLPVRDDGVGGADGSGRARRPRPRPRRDDATDQPARSRNHLRISLPAGPDSQVAPSRWWSCRAAPCAPGWRPGCLQKA